MESHIQSFIQQIASHPEWAGPAMFVVAFGESLAFVSLVFPGTAILLAAGLLMPGGTLPVAPVLVGSILGAVLGDGVSYWIGRRYGHAVGRVWPFRNRPELIAGGISFFQRHGGKSVFIGRFFGPVRAVIPLAAGILGMPAGRFWAANTGSAMVWAPSLLFPGAFVAAMFKQLAIAESALPLVAVFVIIVGIGGVALVAWRGRRR